MDVILSEAKDLLFEKQILRRLRLLGMTARHG
jgi:hypothetical protein